MIWSRRWQGPEERYGSYGISKVQGENSSCEGQERPIGKVTCKLSYEEFSHPFGRCVFIYQTDIIQYGDE